MVLASPIVTTGSKTIPTFTIPVVTAHPVEVVKVKSTLPEEIPVTTPVLVTVAIELSLLTQVPPDVGDKFVVDPIFIFELPVILTTGNVSVVTVTVAVAFVVQGDVAVTVYV